MESLETTPLLPSQSLEKPRTPLPMKQMLMICLVTFIEMIQFGVLFPFVYFMVRDFHVTDDPKKIGSFVGMIASSFSIAQFFTSLPWGFLSDRLGRRPIILIGMAGNAITCTLFGMSKSFGFALAMRSLCGLLNGTVGVTKSMLGEMTDSTNRGLAFSLWESSFGIGQIVGPALGGLLARPAETFPSLFGQCQLLIDYPYLLPCFISSCFSIFGVIVGFFCLDETLKKDENLKPNASIDLLNEMEKNSTSTLVEETSTFSVLTRNVIYSILCYANWAFINVIFDEVLAIFVVTPVIQGGLSLTSKEMGLILSCLGIVQILGQLLIYPICEQKLGLSKTFRLATLLNAIFCFATPFASDLTRHFMNQPNDGSLKMKIYAMLLLLLSGRTIASLLGYVSVMICVNDSCPDTKRLGIVHGTGQVAAAFVRAIGPACGGILWSWSLMNRLDFPFDAHFTMILISILSLGCFIQSFGLVHYPMDSEVKINEKPD